MIVSGNVLKLAGHSVFSWNYCNALISYQYVEVEFFIHVSCFSADLLKDTKKSNLEQCMSTGIFFLGIFQTFAGIEYLSRSSCQAVGVKLFIGIWLGSDTNSNLILNWQTDTDWTFRQYLMSSAHNFKFSRHRFQEMPGYIKMAKYLQVFQSTGPNFNWITVTDAFKLLPKIRESQNSFPRD